MERPASFPCSRTFTDVVAQEAYASCNGHDMPSHLYIHEWIRSKPLMSCCWGSSKLRPIGHEDTPVTLSTHFQNKCAYIGGWADANTTAVTQQKQVYTAHHVYSLVVVFLDLWRSRSWSCMGIGFSCWGGDMPAAGRRRSCLGVMAKAQGTRTICTFWNRRSVGS